MKILRGSRVISCVQADRQTDRQTCRS